MNGLMSHMAAEVRLCTTSEVARKYAVDTSTVRRWVADKRLTPAATTPGGQYRFDPDEVARELHAANLDEDVPA